jgi:hypothetical protein
VHLILRPNAGEGSSAYRRPQEKTGRPSDRPVMFHPWSESSADNRRFPLFDIGLGQRQGSDRVGEVPQRQIAGVLPLPVVILVGALKRRAAKLARLGFPAVVTIARVDEHARGHVSNAEYFRRTILGHDGAPLMVGRNNNPVWGLGNMPRASANQRVHRSARNMSQTSSSDSPSPRRYATELLDFFGA